jgi:hypothetical protein
VELRDEDVSLRLFARASSEACPELSINCWWHWMSAMLSQTSPIGSRRTVAGITEADTGAATIFRNELEASSLESLNESAVGSRREPSALILDFECTNR